VGAAKTLRQPNVARSFALWLDGDVRVCAATPSHARTEQLKSLFRPSRAVLAQPLGLHQQGSFFEVSLCAL
jgi:hypothetical protein